MTANFELASRNHYRFPFNGMISTDDLWELNVQQLDSIFKKLNAQVKQSEEESLLASPSKENIDLMNKIEIIRHIVAYKQALRAEAESAVARAQQRARIEEVLFERESAELRNKSPEELRAMLDQLGK